LLFIFTFIIININAAIISNLTLTSFRQEITDIMHNLSSTQWIDKKEALLDLEVYLRLSAVPLTSFQLKRITDILAKMLLDPHIKVRVCIPLIFASFIYCSLISFPLF